MQAFNTVIINWENAFAAQYQIQWTNEDPATSPTWNVAATNNAGAGGTETVTFNTVQARYIRLFATKRSGTFGYSLFEFQVYNVPTCGGPTERYTISTANTNLVLDNVLGLTWTRTIETDTDPGSQFTGISAAAYCSSINMRLPTKTEALGISGSNNAACAFKGPWSTWTSTVDPNDATETAIVNFDGSTTFNVTNNFPGATLCTVATGSGTSGVQAPVIETQPQAATVAVGESASFTVVATANPAPSYQWLNNGNPITGATGAVYTTPPTVANDNGSQFSVIVSNGGGMVTSAPALLTVTNGSCSTVPTTPGAPTALATSPSLVSLNWSGSTAVSGCSVSYNVYRSTTSGFTPAAGNLVNSGQTATSLMDSGLLAATTYYYVVEAVDAAGNSAPSAQVSAKTLAPTSCTTVPTAPTGLTATAASASSIGLTWTAVTAPGSCTISSYNVYGSTTSGFTPSSANLISAGVTGTSYTNTGLTASTTYYYVVEAVDEDGASAASSQSSATTSAGAPVPDFMLGVSSAALSVTAGNTGTEMVTVTPENGFPTTSPVTFACSGLPNGTTCSFTPATVAANGTIVSSLTINTSLMSAGLRYKPGPLFPGSVLAAALYFFGRKKRRNLQMLMGLSLVALILLAGCGVAPQHSTSTVTVTATSGSLQHTTTFTLTVSTPNPPAGSAAVRTNSGSMLPGSVLALSLCFFDRKRRRLVQSASVMSLLGVALLSGCGAGTTGAPPAGGASNTPTPTMPSISTQPMSQTVSAGQTATFSVVAAGTAPLSYQWLSNGSAISGANGASYTTPATTAQNNGTNYTVMVSNGAGSVTSSAAVLTVTSSNSCSAVPSVPGSVTGSAISTSQINVSWGASSAGSPCTVSYNVFRSTTSGFTPAASNQVAKGIAGTTFGDTGLAASTTYFYLVEAVDAVGSSAASQQISAATLASSSCSTVPSAPTGLTATVVSANVIGLSWAAVAAPVDCSISSYNLYGSTTSGFTPSSSNLIAAGIMGTGYSNTGLTAATTYYYVVEAVDADGASLASVQASATTPGTGGSGVAPSISMQPASQTVTIGTTATFTVAATGTGPFTYQWMKNGVAVGGATSASYNTPSTTATDNNAAFSVRVSDGGQSVTSANAVLTVNSSPAYTIYPGFIGTDLNNNTHGAWRDDQIYIEILGANVTTNALSWVNYDGTVTAASVADDTAANSLTGPDGKTYPNYAFTLAQSNHLLKLPPLNGGRIYVSMGSPMFIRITPGNPLGYAGPNPLNTSDPNSNVPYDWYEFDWGGTQDALFINTTQVDMFGLPMTLDVWGKGETFHQQTGITESIAALDQEFTAETPAAFQAGQSPISPLRIWAPAHKSFGNGGANANYFDSYVASAWSSYSTTPLTVAFNGRQFTGRSSGSTLTFTEVNPKAANAGEVFVVSQPSTQDIFECAGTMASGVQGNTPQLQDENGVELQLENQICSATNRGVLLNPANWANVSAYYSSAPANFYSQFWHNHSIAGLAYGYSYDDNNNQSTSIVGASPEHMAFGISW